MRIVSILMMTAFVAATAADAAPHSSAPRYAHPEHLTGGGCVYSVCVDLIQAGETNAKEQCFGAKVYHACID